MEAVLESASRTKLELARDVALIVCSTTITFFLILVMLLSFLVLKNMIEEQQKLQKAVPTDCETVRRPECSPAEGN